VVLASASYSKLLAVYQAQKCC